MVLVRNREVPLTTLTTKGQVTIPKSIREVLHLNAGDKVEFILSENNEVILRPVTKKTDDVFGKLSKYKKDAPVAIEDMNDAIKNKIRNRFS